MAKRAVHRAEQSSLPRLQTAEIYGAVTLGGIIILVILVRWLAH